MEQWEFLKNWFFQTEVGMQRSEDYICLDSMLFEELKFLSKFNKELTGTLDDEKNVPGLSNTAKKRKTERTALTQTLKGLVSTFELATNNLMTSFETVSNSEASDPETANYRNWLMSDLLLIPRDLALTDCCYDIMVLLQS